MTTRIIEAAAVSGRVFPLARRPGGRGVPTAWVTVARDGVVTRGSVDARPGDLVELPIADARRAIHSGAALPGAAPGELQHGAAVERTR